MEEGSQGWSQGFSLSYREKDGAVGVIYWAREDSMEGRVFRIFNPCTSGLRYLLVTQVTIGLALGFMRLQCRLEIPVWELSEGIIVRVQPWISKWGQDEMGRWRGRHDVPIRIKKKAESVCIDAGRRYICPGEKIILFWSYLFTYFFKWGHKLKISRGEREECWRSGKTGRGMEWSSWKWRLWQWKAGEMWPVAGWFSVSLEMYGQTFKVKILCVLSSHVQPLGCRLGVGVELSWNLPNECNGATEGQERE